MPTNRLKLRMLGLGRGEIWALSAAICYSCYNVFIRWSLTESNPLVGSTLKIVPLIVISFFVLLKKKELYLLNYFSPEFIGIKNIGIFIILGIAYYVAGNLLLFSSFKSGGVVLTAPLLGTQVLWSALLAYFFLKEKLTRNILSGIILSIVGLTILSFSQHTISKTIFNIYSILFGLGAAFCYSFGNLIQRHILHNKKINYWIVIFSSLFSAEIVLNIVYFYNNGNIIFISESPRNILTFLGAGILGAGSIYCITKAFSLTNVATAVTINSGNIALSPILAYLLLGEQLTIGSILGISTIFIGIIIVQLQK